MQYTQIPPPKKIGEGILGYLLTANISNFFIFQQETKKNSELLSIGMPL